jgi:hypothetical protein
VRYWLETRRFAPDDFEFFGRAADTSDTSGTRGTGGAGGTGGAARGTFGSRPSGSIMRTVPLAGSAVRTAVRSGGAG